MFTNLYHITSFCPALDGEEMTVGREKLAQDLVKSGRLRIDAGEKINFARLYIPNMRISMVFSYRELYEPDLIDRTTLLISNELKGAYSGEGLENKVQNHIELLKKELEKYQKISLDEEIKLARLIVQATHPVVMMLILEENVEIFISHSHNIGDVLDIVSWQTAGSNNGMQSTNGKDVAIFISCGGNPLAENEDKSAEYGDGWPARARIMVIGGQELGHYSDIMRDENGKQFSRYSANFGATKAKEDVRLARIHDIKRSLKILNTLQELGLENAIITEKNIKFYQDNKKVSLDFIFQRLKLIVQKILLKYRAKKHEIFFLDEFKNEPRMFTVTKAMIEDMLFNLSPQADVYKSDNKTEEEAIACVEALARVPQQTNKWGRVIAKEFMKDLYMIYYSKVIHGCIEAYQNITHKKYEYESKKIGGTLLYFIKKLLRKNPYYPPNISSLLK